MHSDLWRGYSGYWQNRFIRENLIPLGHAAWQGFIIQGRGIVVCDVVMPMSRSASTDAESMDWTRESVEYTARFVPLSGISDYLQALNLEAPLLERLIDTARTYDPTQTILLLINKEGQIEINLLQNLAIPPDDCHRQMQQRCSEFQLEPPERRKPF
ncbi:MAG: hypothetical protein AAGE59_13085 [Cyanobacteria bacterium P01_F01_bin.86]